MWTANYLLADEAQVYFKEQGIDASVVLTSSANAVVSKRGSEAYDVSKAALSHLVRELAVGMAPRVRVNGISPATVVKGSTMFPRDRVLASLKKYNLPADEVSQTMTNLAQRVGAILCEAHPDTSADRSEGLRAGHSSFWRGQRHAARPDTSYQWTAVWWRRICDDAR